MDLVRVPREETVYEREAVLGRDTSSVFPKEAEKAKKEHLENIKKAVGLDSSRFITESQLEAIKKERGPSVEDGTIARDKTLAAILAENKAKKEEQFANVWKSMKQGKNRPLDEDEMEFMNTLADKELSRRRELQEAENEELTAFQEAVRQRAHSHQAASASPKPAADEASQEAPKQIETGSKLAVTVKPLVIVAKRKANAGQKDDSKRLRKGEDKPPDNSHVILGSILSDYGSDGSAEQ